MRRRPGQVCSRADSRLSFSPRLPTVPGWAEAVDQTGHGSSGLAAPAGPAAPAESAAPTASSDSAFAKLKSSAPGPWAQPPDAAVFHGRAEDE